MKHVLLKSLVPLFVTVLFLFSSCQREVDLILKQKTGVDIQFSHQVDDQPLVYGNTYTNPLGEDYTVTKFKYYISKIRLENTAAGSHSTEDENYFLVDEAQANSKKISFNAETGNYNAVSFLLGVDSIRNVSGAQTGALDPANDMFWTWNSGYIMVKLEGQSSFSTLINNEIEYHIGGFKGTDNVVKRIVLPFSQSIEIKNDKAASILISADINKWFKHIHDLPIAMNPACVMPGNLATQYAANYAGMFQITQIENN